MIQVVRLQGEPSTRVRFPKTQIPNPKSQIANTSIDVDKGSTGQYRRRFVESGN